MHGVPQGSHSLRFTPCRQIERCRFSGRRPQQVAVLLFLCRWLHTLHSECYHSTQTHVPSILHSSLMPCSHLSTRNEFDPRNPHDDAVSLHDRITAQIPHSSCTDFTSHLVTSGTLHNSPAVRPTFVSF